MKQMSTVLSTASDRERAEYGSWDTFFIALGSIFLILAFLVRPLAG